MRNLIEHRTLRLRRGLTFIALAAALGLAAAALTQCRMTTDPVSGVDLRIAAKNHGRECIERCREAFQEAKAKEFEQFQQNLKECDGDHECRRAARQAHRENMEKLRAEKRECKANCYNEGGGDGGDGDDDD